MNSVKWKTTVFVEASNMWLTITKAVAYYTIKAEKVVWHRPKEMKWQKCLFLKASQYCAYACSRNFISTIENLIQTPLFHITLSQCFPILSACPRTTTMQHIKNSAFVHANSRSYKSSIEYLIQTPLFHFTLSSCFLILCACPRTTTIQLIQKR